MLVGEIDSINDNMRLLYLGKYFAKPLADKDVKMQLLYRGDSSVDSLSDFLNIHEKHKNHRPRKLSGNIGNMELLTQCTFRSLESF